MKRNLRKFLRGMQDPLLDGPCDQWDDQLEQETCLSEKSTDKAMLTEGSNSRRAMFD